MFDVSWLSFAIFIIILAALIIRDRKNVKLEGIMFIRRTQRGVSLLDRIATKRRRFWHYMSLAGVIVAVPSIVIATWIIMSSVFGLLSGVSDGGVKLVLPWPGGTAESHTGMLLVPWYFWVIGVFSLMIPHEFFHGIMSRLQKIKVKSMGWVVLVVLPGAFVEPDESRLKKSSVMTRLKVYSAGSFANFIVAAVFFAILMMFFMSFIMVAGITPAGVIENYPAHRANISGAITEIIYNENYYSIRSASDLSSALSQMPPNSSIILRTITGNWSLITAESPDVSDKSFIGVLGPYAEYKEVKAGIKNTIGEPLIIFFNDLFAWIFILNLGVGLVNLLPIKPLDGGLIFESIMSKFTKKSRKITHFVSALILTLLIFSVIGGFFV